MKLWTHLGFRPATLAQLDVRLRDGGGAERQPAPRRFIVTDERPPKRRGRAKEPPVISVWRGQEPAERIANTILLCAIRDRASQVIMEPRARELRVQFLLPQGVREQKLPRFALQPIVHHFQSLAQIEEQEVESFAVDLAVDEELYTVEFSALPTQWGRGVTLQFSLDE